MSGLWVLAYPENGGSGTFVNLNLATALFRESGYVRITLANGERYRFGGNIKEMFAAAKETTDSLVPDIECTAGLTDA